jgi:hypothetical protein
MKWTRAMRKQIEHDNRQWPPHLVEVPRERWPDLIAPGLRAVWRSRFYLVQVYAEAEDVIRLTVCSTTPTGDNLSDGIAWDTLQRLKRECGFGDREAVEVYPRDVDIVNVANMRHLWLLPTPLTFAWRATRRGP